MTFKGLLVLKSCLQVQENMESSLVSLTLEGMCLLLAKQKEQRLIQPVLPTLGPLALGYQQLKETLIPLVKQHPANVRGHIPALAEG